MATLVIEKATLAEEYSEIYETNGTRRKLTYFMDKKSYSLKILFYIPWWQGGSRQRNSEGATRSNDDVIKSMTSLLLF